jgi:hypothetical protein
MACLAVNWPVATVTIGEDAKEFPLATGRYGTPEFSSPVFASVQTAVGLRTAELRICRVFPTGYVLGAVYDGMLDRNAEPIEWSFQNA